jgi:hypothetical protein
MTPERKTEIKHSIIQGMSRFGIDPSKSHQSMGLIGLSQMCAGIPRNEFITVLQSMKGVVIDFEVSPAEVRIPTSYFTKP